MCSSGMEHTVFSNFNISLVDYVLWDTVFIICICMMLTHSIVIKKLCSLYVITVIVKSGASFTAVGKIMLKNWV